MPKKPKQNPELLKRIRSNYDFALEHWGRIHQDGNMDVRFIAGDPWDPRDVNARETAEQKRPHLVFDEGSQYINMFCGQAMQQKRAVKVEPVDERIDSKTAEVMQGRVMHIDYVGRGGAHSIKALRDCATRGYGWMSMRKKYSTPDGREQEPCWNPVANPDSRLPDPNFKEPDASDMEFCFVRDIWTKVNVKKKWPHATDIGSDEVKTTTLVEYWEVTKKVVDCRYWIEDPESPDGTQEILKSQLNGMEIPEDSILDERDIEEKTITKYICQIVDPSGTADAMELDPITSVEILEVEDWDGQWIPEVPVLGQEYYINNGGTVRKVYLSMIRRARDAMGLLNLTRTNQAEIVAMTPKTRFLGYEGQFEGHESEFQNIGTSPLAYLQVKPTVDPITGAVLPLPEKIQWEPPIQALEILAQSCQNAIRSAIGQLASPELDKTKSGIALQKIREGGESAVYYILNAFDVSLTQVGRVEGDLMERTHDTKRKVAIRKPDGEQELVQLNAPYDDKKGARQHHPIEKGAFSYTITTGPSYQSQFEQASEFVDVLVSKVPQLLVDGQGHTVFGDLFVKLKNMGPIGDQIVDRFKKMLRPELAEQEVDIPPAVLAEMQKAQQVIDGLTEKVNTLAHVIETKQIELESEERRAEADNKTKIAIAEINAQVKENIHQLQVSMDQIALRLNAQFEAIEGEMTHRRALEASSQDQEEALEAQDVAHEQGLETQEQAAELAPEPAASSQ